MISLCFAQISKYRPGISTKSCNQKARCKMGAYSVSASYVISRTFHKKVGNYRFCYPANKTPLRVNIGFSLNACRFFYIKSLNLHLQLLLSSIHICQSTEWVSRAHPKQDGMICLLNHEQIVRNITC